MSFINRYVMNPDLHKHNLNALKKQLASQADLSEVVNRLEALTADTRLENALLVLQARQLDLKNRQLKGILSSDEYLLEKTKLVDGLLNLIDELKALPKVKYKEVTVSTAQQHLDRRFATAEEVQLWKKHFSATNTFHRKEKELALSILQAWEHSAAHFTQFRMWGSLPANKQAVAGIQHRFWSLFHLKQDQSKWIWFVWDSRDSKIAVVKEIRPDAEQTDKNKRLQWEKDIYEQFRYRLKNASKGMVQLIDSGDDWFATSLAQNGNIHWHLFGYTPQTEEDPIQVVREKLFSKKIPFKGPELGDNWKQIRSLFVQYFHTLAEIHDYGYVHRDISLHNLLINSYGRKVEGFICDFDRTIQWQDDQLPPRFLRLPGEGNYAAPERISFVAEDDIDRERLKAFYGLPACDVYQLAVCLLGILTGHISSTHKERVEEVRKQKKWPVELRRLLLKSLSENPHKRPSARECAQKLEHIRWSRRKLVQTVFVGMLFLLAFLYSYQKMINPCFPLGKCVDDDGYVDAQQTLESGRTYILKNGITYVDSGAVLQIKEGAKILGHERSLLIIGKGGRIEAQGTAEKPIVFSSIKPDGYWGGLVLLGRAPVLGDKGERQELLEFFPLSQYKEHPQWAQYGGDLPHDDSGILEHLVIKRAGWEIVKDKESNGLTLAGVGDQTRIQHIDVIESKDDCFEIFGGTIHADYLTCIEPGDDGFDWDHGYKGSLQHLIMDRTTKTENTQYGLEGMRCLCFSSDDPRVAIPEGVPQISDAFLINRQADQSMDSTEVMITHHSPNLKNIQYLFGEKITIDSLKNIWPK